MRRKIETIRMSDEEISDMLQKGTLEKGTEDSSRKEIIVRRSVPAAEGFRRRVSREQCLDVAAKRKMPRGRSRTPREERVAREEARIAAEREKQTEISETA